MKTNPTKWTNPLRMFYRATTLYISSITKITLLVSLSFLSNTKTWAQSNDFLYFTDFKFHATNIGWEEDWIGVINDDERTITFTTQKWIENITELSAIFSVKNNPEVKVNDMIQESGVTTNDFRKDVVYTVNDINYTVIFNSPQASGIPVIKIDTENNTPITSKEDYSNMLFTLTDCNFPENNLSKTDMKDQVRGRGNDSWKNPNAKKKILPY